MVGYKTSLFLVLRVVVIRRVALVVVAPWTLVVLVPHVVVRIGRVAAAISAIGVGRIVVVVIHIVALVRHGPAHHVT